MIRREYQVSLCRLYDLGDEDREMARSERRGIHLACTQARTPSEPVVAVLLILIITRSLLRQLLTKLVRIIGADPDPGRKSGHGPVPHLPKARTHAHDFQRYKGE